MHLVEQGVEKNYAKKLIRHSIRRIKPEHQKTGKYIKKQEELLKSYLDAASVNLGIVSVLILKQYMSQLDYTSYSAKTVQPNQKLRLQNGEWTKFIEEAYEHLLKVHFPGCSISKTPTSVGTDNGRHKWIPSFNWSVAAEIVTEDRIRWAFSTMSSYKSTAEDGIFPALLQKEVSIY